MSMLQWQKVKKAGLAPSPARSSFAVVHCRQAAYLFGGITDQAGTKDASYSELYNELCALCLCCAESLGMHVSGFIQPRRKPDILHSSWGRDTINPSI